VKFANASGEVEDAIYDEWKVHIAPSGAIVGMEAAARAYNQAGHQGRRASWTDIGRAVGISRQSAHERWAEKLAGEEDDHQAHHSRVARRHQRSTAAIERGTRTTPSAKPIENGSIQLDQQWELPTRLLPGPIRFVGADTSCRTVSG
jgi:hypothetical protein